ncbi:MAG: tripartite tricarboxylate transporter substrate binding protein [Betaproteobacteria bacterium]|nr:tripartite tricarboxylate transporter substrate binding protein [Betaproteobacteria bacterium]
MIDLSATLLRASLAVAAMLAAPPLVLAQQYPTKPVRIVVPFAPGGGSDFIARFMAQRLTGALGHQVIVENKPGAGGVLGIETGIKSPPDGYTLTLIASSYTVNPSIYKLGFDPNSDITPIIQMSQGPLLVVVNPALPVKTTRDLIALAKSKPGEVNFASSGQGSVIHLATEMFANMAGVKMNHIPYKGTGPALTDTIAGQTNVFFSSTANAMPHVKSGRLRAVAVTTAKRIPALPEVPSIAESGVPGYDVTLWHGLIGPKGLPRAITDRINGEVTKALTLKETAEQLQNDGVAPAGGTPEQFAAQIRKEIASWRKVAADAGVKAE